MGKIFKTKSELFDLSFTLGISALFMISSLFTPDILFKIVSVSFFSWLSYSWYQYYKEHKTYQTNQNDSHESVMRQLTTTSPNC